MLDHFNILCICHKEGVRVVCRILARLFSAFFVLVHALEYLGVCSETHTAQLCDITTDSKARISPQAYNEMVHGPCAHLGERT